MKSLILTCVVFCLFSVALAQSFSKMDISHLPEVFNTSSEGNGLSLHDIDRDGFLDLTICLGYEDPLFLKNTDGVFSVWDLGITSNTMMRHFNWVDMDNDGDADACFTSAEGTIEIWEQTGELVFENVTEASGMEDQNSVAYCNSWGDYDRDGILDCYFPVWGPYADHVNRLYRGNGDMTFELVSEDSPVNDGNRRSFLGTFVDFDRDLFPEIFVINDDSASPNSLYDFTQSGFLDVSVEAGVDQTFYTMSATIGDINNDGYLDIFMTNNDQGYYLLENDGDLSFTQVTSDWGIDIPEFGWAGNFADFNSDGWLDLQICNEPWLDEIGQNRLLRNESGTGFTDITEEVGMGPASTDSYCSVVGDVNNDGFQDVVVFSMEPVGLEVWLNEPVQKDWVKVNMSGTVSNADAIGTLVEVYVEDLYQVRYTLCGESFLSQNSSTMHFGLNDQPWVDSLVVTYPSGIVDHYYHLDVNTTYDLIEGETAVFSLETAGDLELCVGETFTITTDHPNNEVTWQDGTVASEYTVTQSGQYHATLVNQFGLPVLSDTLNVLIYPEIGYVAEVADISCLDSTGGITIVPLVPDVEISWENAALAGWQLQDLPPGDYAYTISNALGCSVSGSESLSTPVTITVDVTSMDATCFDLANGSANLEPSGGGGTFEIDWGGFNPDSLAAGTYTAVITDDLGCEFLQEVSIAQPLEIDLVFDLSHVLCHGDATGSAAYTASGGTGIILPDWGSWDPSSLPAGDYDIAFTDEAACVVTGTFTIEEPDPLTSVVEEMWDDEFGIQVNLTIAGGIPPYLVEWTDGSDVWSEEDPFLPPNADMNLTITDANDCVLQGTWTEVEIHGVPAVFNVFPNPTADLLNASVTESGLVTIRDLSGREVLTQLLIPGLNRITLDGLPAGQYQLAFETGRTLEVVGFLKF